MVVSGVLPLIGTYLGLALFLSITAHVAARNVLGDVPIARALPAGPVVALVPFLLQAGGALLIIPFAVAADLLVVQMSYRLKWRTAAFVVFIHVVVTTLLAITLGALAMLLATRPG